MTSLMNADPSSSSSSAALRAAARRPDRHRQSGVVQQAAGRSGEQGRHQSCAILAAMKKPKTPGAQWQRQRGWGRGPPAPGRYDVGHGWRSTPLPLKLQHRQRRGGAVARRTRRWVRKLTSCGEDHQRVAEDAYLAKQQILDVKQQLKDVDDLKKVPEVEEEHRSSAPQQSVDSLVMLNNNRELKKTCDTPWRGRRISASSTRSSTACSARTSCSSRASRTSAVRLPAGGGRNGGARAEIRRRPRPWTTPFGALSSFHEM